MKNQFLFVLISLCVLSCAKKPSSYSNKLVEISGVIISESNEPLPFVDVLLFSLSDTSKTKTNLDGEFKFEDNSKGEYSLTVSFTGYSKFDSIVLVTDKTPYIKINLLPDTSLFNRVKLSGFNKSTAENDIENNNIRLLFPGGIAGASKAPFDESFEEKYNLNLIHPGCIKFSWDNYKEYNFEIFSYLDSLYGLEWRDAVRNEIVGIKEYIESKKTDTLIITALNLSEDMSVLSTKNDEIFLFVYEVYKSKKLCSPLVSKKLLFDKEHTSYKIPFTKKDDLIVFLIEEDSFREIIEIEPVVRLNYWEIITNQSYNEVKKYLGEDDLLGVDIINKNTSLFKMSGTNSLDKYEYSFEIK